MCTSKAAITDLKLAHFSIRSPLPIAALPSISLIPSARFADRAAQTQKETVRFMKITQNAINVAVDWGAHAASRAGDGGLAITNLFLIPRLPQGRGKQHARARALAGAFALICLFLCTTALAQNPDNIAEREVQRRQAGIPAGEAALARG